MNNTKNKIINAAIALFQQQGYSKTTVVSICRRSGVTKATFYAYFGNKDDLIYAYSEQQVQQLTHELPYIMATYSTKEQIWKIYEHNIDSMLQLCASTCKDFFLSDIQRGMLYFSPRSATKISTARYQQTQLVNILIGKAQTEGEIRPYKPEVLNQTFVKLIIVTCLDWCSNSANYDLKAELRRMFDALF